MGRNTPQTGAPGVGWQAGGAANNRQREARLGIIQALRRLGIPPVKWLDCVRTYWGDASEQTEYRHIMSPPKFQPPVFDRLNQSLEDWVKVADGAWTQHRDQFVRGCKYWEAVGVDEEISESKRSRGPGKAPRQRRRQNSVAEQRYEWAAWRLCGDEWKEVAAKYAVKESTVIKAASSVLRTAGWPTKRKAEP